MTSQRFPVSLHRTSEQNHVRANAQALQHTFTGPGFDTPRDKDNEISVAVLDAIDAIQRERHKRRASALAASKTRATTG